MSFRVSVRDLAEQDLAEAYDQYEAKQVGLGDDLHEVAGVLHRIGENPKMYPHSEVARYRKAIESRFLPPHG